WRLGAEHLGHHVRLIVIRLVGPLVELLDVSQEKRPLGMSLLGLATHHAIEIPKYFQFLWYHRVGTEDAPPGKVGLQTLEHDYVRGEQQDGLSVIFANFVRLT